MRPRDHTLVSAQWPPGVGDLGGWFPRATPSRRLHVRLCRGRLDRRLIDGEDIAGSPVLALRARQLTSARWRRRAARAIDRLLADGCRPGPFSLAVCPACETLASVSAQLRAIRDRLAGPGAVYARGVAHVAELLWDGSGPLYRQGSTRAARMRVDSALRALSGST